MKMIEILAGDPDNLIRDTFLPPHRIPDQDLMAHIANALTRDRVVKLLWDLHMADQIPAQEPSPEDTGMHQEAGDTGLGSLTSSSGANRAVRFTPPF